MRLTIKARLGLGILLVAATVLAMAGLSRWTTRVIRRESTGSTDVLARAVETQKRFLLVNARLDELRATRAALDQALRGCAEAMIANQPQIALFPGGAADPIETFLAGSSARELPGEIPGVKEALAALEQAHRDLRTAESEIAGIWTPRHEGLQQALGELKRAVTTWCLKIANMIFVQSSLVELIYEDVRDSPVEQFLASPVYARHGASLPEFTAAATRVRAANLRLLDGARRLNGLAMASKWDEIRRDYRDLFPPQLTAISVEIDAQIEREEKILRDQERALVLLNGKMRDASRRTGEALGAIEGLLVASVHGVRTDADIAASLALAGGRGVSGRILALERLNLALAGIAILFAMAGGIFIARSVTLPLGEVVGSLRTIGDGQGDLTRRLSVRSNDELGDLSTGFNRFVGRLSEMVCRIRLVSADLGGVTGGIRSAAERVQTGSQAQSRAIRVAQARVRGIAASSTAIAAGARELAATADETAVAAHEVSAASREIDDQMQSFSGVARDVGSALEMATQSVGVVGSTLEQLSMAAQDGSAVIAQLEQAIAAVEEKGRTTDLHARQAEIDAVQGAQAVAAALSGIRALSEVVHHTRDVISDLSGRSEQIGGLVVVIEEILDQTQLLALNAAIIAAQAGDHGHGFSVVAREMRRLAERTALSTKEIVTIVAGVQGATREAVRTIEAGRERVDAEVARAQDAGRALELIRESAARARENVAVIASAVADQSAGSRSLTAAVARIGERVQTIGQAVHRHGGAVSLAAGAARSLDDIAQRVRAGAAEQVKAATSVSRRMEHVRTLASGIDAATHDQSGGAEAVLAAVGEVDGIARENAARVTELNHVVAALTRQTGGLEEEVGRFVIDGDCQRGAARPQPEAGAETAGWGSPAGNLATPELVG